MAIPEIMQGRLSIPVVGSPLFIISNPDLVIAQCKAGIVGSFPSLNARPLSVLDEWLNRITTELAEYDAAHPDAPSALIAVAAGAGGHAGALSPFALMQELREWFDGPVLLSGSIANGSAVLAAQAMGADMAYVGSAFIATKEANAAPEYKQALVDYAAEDIVYSNLFTGVHGNYLAPSIAAAGLDPANLPKSDPSEMNFGSGGDADSKAWKDIWGCGQGIGAVKSVVSAAELVERLVNEYTTAKQRLTKI
jgi:NAD(P)H-dependent flavin oxidoreductase YrpB (nitropropane dioxygenase family)